MKNKGTLCRKDKPISCYYDNNGCLICTSHTLGNDGYPQIQRDMKRWRLSRWVFYTNYGYLPKLVRHICDNPKCINPLHLIEGDEKENSKDMLIRGRAPSENKGKPKLNEEKVKQIKQKLKQEISLMKLSKEYNVSKKNILNIKQGKKWSWVKD